MEEYLVEIEKHIKRSIYPVGVILSGVLITQVYANSEEKAWQLYCCATLLLVSGFGYLVATGYSAVIGLTSIVGSRGLKFFLATYVVLIYISIFAAGFASGLLAHNKAFKSPSAGTAQGASL